MLLAWCGTAPADVQDCGGIPLLLQAAASQSAGQQRAAAAALANLCSEPSLLQRVVAEPGSLPALVGLAQSRDRDVQVGPARFPAASAPPATGGKGFLPLGLGLAATRAGAARWDQAAVKVCNLADIMDRGCSQYTAARGWCAWRCCACCCLGISCLCFVPPTGASGAGWLRLVPCCTPAPLNLTGHSHEPSPESHAGGCCRHSRAPSPI